MLKTTVSHCSGIV